LLITYINFKILDIEITTVKRNNQSYHVILFKVRDTSVILAEVEIGVQLGIMLANSTVHELIKLDNHYNVVEFPYNPSWIGQSIVDIDFRNQYQTNIIAIQPAETNEFTIEFGTDYVVSKSDIFLRVTTDDAVKKLVD